MQYLLYGANGYTAKLIIEASIEQELRPTLAGRNREKIERVARKYDLPYQVFDLSDPGKLREVIGEFSLCVNAAGPFSQTAMPLVKACLDTGAHYLDITGELAVFEQLKALDQQAKKVDVLLMPGVGFDVVPSDCLANYLHEKMPDADSLELAFTSRGSGLSHGTASTMLSHLGEGGAVRRKGKIKRVDLFHKSKVVDFGSFSRTMATIPWGDISTAYTSTGIPNIEVYTGVRKKWINLMQYQQWFNPLLRTALLRKVGQRWVDKNLYGPSAAQNEKGRSYLHGKVTNTQENNCAILECPESYWLTALCTVLITKKVLDGDLQTGYQTPAGAYGWKLILEVPGTEIKDVACV